MLGALQKCWTGKARTSCSSSSSSSSSNNNNCNSGKNNGSSSRKSLIVTMVLMVIVVVVVVVVVLVIMILMVVLQKIRLRQTLRLLGELLTSVLKTPLNCGSEGPHLYYRYGSSSF